MKNIEEFNIAVAEIFGTCYQSFPRTVSIYKTEIAGAIKEGMGLEYDPTIINMSEHEYKVVDFTLSWLIQAGYIWTDNVMAPTSSMKIRLSPLGLEVLNSIPESLETSERIGESLAKGAKKLSKEMLFTMINTALSIGLSS